MYFRWSVLYSLAASGTSGSSGFGLVSKDVIESNTEKKRIRVDVVEWSRALDVMLSEWCCSVSIVWVQIPSREEQKFDSSKI